MPSPPENAPGAAPELPVPYPVLAPRITAARPISAAARGTDDARQMDDILANLGYGYDERQNVFYSLVNAWQRKYGYCSLYDESSAPSGMIVDAEPIYFNYGGRRYLLELWKGQYGMTTGCEVGFYRDSGKKLLGAEWFESVPNAEMLDMSATLLRDGALVFTRRAIHWWLTGFRLGMFSEPSSLAMLVRIMFPDCTMCCAFLAAARALGYSEREAFAQGTSVTIYFGVPKSRQPATRTRLLMDFTQTKNRLLCEEFMKLVGEDGNMYEILAGARIRHPELYASAMRIGRAPDPLVKFTGELPDAG
jgi:hypothetical protein